MNESLEMQRLAEELIYAIRRFHSYVPMALEDKNKCVVQVLEELLIEASKSGVK